MDCFATPTANTRRNAWCWVLMILSAVAFEVRSMPASTVPVERGALSEWIMTYYQHPQPDQFVEMVKNMVVIGVMRTQRPDSNVMFLGKLMAQHPAKVAGWLDALAFLKDVEPKDAVVLYRAAWYSGTAEAKAWLAAHGEKGLADAEPPPLLSNKPMAFEAHHLDMLWEWFFASGEEAPVRRIISFFRLAAAPPPPDSLDLPRAPAKTGDRIADSIAAVNASVAYAAVWSTTSLAATHERVFEILKKEGETRSVDPMQRAWLQQAIKVATVNRRAPQPVRSAAPGPKPSATKAPAR